MDERSKSDFDSVRNRTYPLKDLLNQNLTYFGSPDRCYLENTDRNGLCTNGPKYLKCLLQLQSKCPRIIVAEDIKNATRIIKEHSRDIPVGKCFDGELDKCLGDLFRDGFEDSFRDCHVIDITIEHFNTCLATLKSYCLTDDQNRRLEDAVKTVADTHKKCQKWLNTPEVECKERD